ncbi:ABC transporter ATP-binding protein [Cyanobacterium stanieri LEGE 03274]|uniref:ABC transporter ATP-binding protein n=1 Tax=Cyanobacterium stanieri LEGE 03274 TaxID=1828756 RepID=A0ABR9V5V8_9CHRO|nr:ABC transporter ATP-binding protein [Cyanobacterium stanieri]MBE9223252.1 ABC transporter ATP-binding protein [Cyanobacterium stanieri LEGE 03274]
MKILEVQDLEVTFFDDDNQPSIAVNKINFDLEAGKTLGIVGESGSGKSVTSLAVMGLIAGNGKTHGQIWYQDNTESSPIDLQSLSEEERREYRGGKIAMIFQEPMSSLNPLYNIGFQITEAILQHQQISESEARRQAIALLQEVKLLADDQTLTQEFYTETNNINPSPTEVNQYINQRKREILKRYPHEMSGGQLQRVMIAMAISCNPRIIIADEPTTALDVTVQATILELLKELAQTRQMSVIFITHDLAVVANIADSLAVMYQGKILEYGKAQDVLLNPQSPYTKGLLACRPRLDEDREYLPTVACLMANDGEIPEINLPPKEVNLNKPLIAVENLIVGFRKPGIFSWGIKPADYFWAVDDVSFQVFGGETLGLVGESGCGKSTLARTLLRLINPISGKIEFMGQDLAKYKKNDPRLRKLRRELQIVFQNPYNSLNPRMSIGKTIIEPMEIHKMGGNSRKRKERVAYLLERVGLSPDWFNRYPHELSGGQRQRVCIAKALALNPQLIICDESVSALDVSIQAQVLNLLKELQRDFGLTYIFISHDLSVVKFMSDRIMVMNKGKIEEIATTEQIINHPQRDYTKKLIASIPKFPTLA